MNMKADAGTIHDIELGVKLLLDDGNPEAAPREAMRCLTKQGPRIIPRSMLHIIGAMETSLLARLAISISVAASQGEARKEKHDIGNRKDTP